MAERDEARAHAEEMSLRLEAVVRDARSAAALNDERVAKLQGRLKENSRTEAVLERELAAAKEREADLAAQLKDVSLRLKVSLSFLRVYVVCAVYM